MPLFTHGSRRGLHFYAALASGLGLGSSFSMKCFTYWGSIIFTIRRGWLGLNPAYARAQEHQVPHRLSARLGMTRSGFRSGIRAFGGP